MAVGEGTDQLGGDLGAAHRGDGDPEAVLEHRDVEAGEVHQFDGGGIGQHAGEVRAVETASTERGRAELHEMGDVVASRQLHEA